MAILEDTKLLIKRNVAPKMTILTKIVNEHFVTFLSILVDEKQTTLSSVKL